MSDAGSRALDEQPKPPDSSYVVSPVPTKELLSARAKSEDDARDAARYRWLREVALRFDEKRQGVEVYEFIGPIAYGPNIDAAIDAQIAEEAEARA